MPERAIGVSVSITRYVSDDPQPGIVECEFSDANGRRWSFVEKTAIVSAEYLDARTSYPRPGVIACEIVERRRDGTGQEIIVIDTERPWGVESIDGSKRFEVIPASLVEWDWGSKEEHA
jgi:hypothetical protein